MSPLTVRFKYLLHRQEAKAQMLGQMELEGQSKISDL